MERRVKERLIGAAVLMAAAVILIPEMLSGPRSGKHDDTITATAQDAPVKSYSIDLSGTPGATKPSASVETTQAPPSERAEATAAPAASTPPVESKAPELAATTEPPTTAEKMPEQETKSAAPVVASPPVVKPLAPAPAAAGKPAPSAGHAQWAVQIGSYASKATAERMAQSLKENDFPAFVMPVTTGASTLYRVRVGPVPTRPDAEAMQRKLKSSNPQATVVAHP